MGYINRVYIGVILGIIVGVVGLVVGSCSSTCGGWLVYDEYSDDDDDDDDDDGDGDVDVVIAVSILRPPVCFAFLTFALSRLASFWPWQAKHGGVRELCGHTGLGSILVAASMSRHGSRSKGWFPKIRGPRYRPQNTIKSLRLSPPTAGAQMVRAAGQGHGRNDAATTDPQPKLQILGVRLGPGSRLGASRGLGPGPTRAWGPGAWGPGPRAAPKSCFVALKSLLS